MHKVYTYMRILFLYMLNHPCILGIIPTWSCICLLGLIGSQWCSWPLLLSFHLVILSISERGYWSVQLLLLKNCFSLQLSIWLHIFWALLLGVCVRILYIHTYIYINCCIFLMDWTFYQSIISLFSSNLFLKYILNDSITIPAFLVPSNIFFLSIFVTVRVSYR